MIQEFNILVIKKVLGSKGSDLLKYDPSRFIEIYEMMKISVESTAILVCLLF